MIKLIAARGFPYRYRSLRAGDEFDATETDALALIGTGFARAFVDEPIKTRALTPEAAVEAAVEPAGKGSSDKRAYKRRDMVARA